MAYGQDTVLGICLQNSYGTASVSSLHFMEILSEGLTPNKEQQVREGMRGIIDENDSQEGKNSIEADIAIEALAVPLGAMLSTMFEGTTTGSGIYTHTFKPRQTDFDRFATNRPFTALVDMGDGGSAHQYSDLVTSKLELSLSPGGFMKSTISLLGGKYEQIAPVAGSFPTGDVVDWSVSSITSPDAICRIEDLTLVVDDGLESTHTLCSQKTPRFVKRGSASRTTTISGTMLFLDQEDYQRYLAQSTHRLYGVWQVNSDMVAIDAPQFKYTSFPIPVDGPGLLRVSFEGKCEYHTGSATAIAITVVNTQPAY